MRKIVQIIPGILIGGLFIIYYLGGFELYFENYCINRFSADKQIGQFCNKRIRYLVNYAYKNRKENRATPVKITNSETLWKDKKGYIVSINYEDADGNLTKRKIKITQVKKNSDSQVYLVAYCYEKKGRRLFRMDRVKEFYNQNGELISTNEVLKTLNIKK